MQDNTSPEERLLRLIRSEHKKSSARQEQTTRNIDGTKSEKITQQEQLLRKSRYRRFSLRGICDLAKIGEHFSFNQINRIFFVILLALGIYLLADFLIKRPATIEKRLVALGEIKDVASLEIPAKTAPSVKPVSYYSQPVKSRNLFTATTPKAELTRPSPTFMEMISRLRLQGIIPGSNPQAVIEDIKTKQVYFLSPGDYIGEIELKQILPGKVKLNYYGQEAELAL